MAEITLEPTVLSKVIPLSLKLNEVDSSLTGQLVTKQQFNTADTDAWFSFTLDGLAATTGTFDLTLINLQDKSVFNHDAIAFSTNPFYYKLDSGADELTNEIRHAGKWVGQLVVTLPNGDSATRKFIFSIEGHILDGTVVQTILLEDYNALIASIEASKDELAQYNIDYASLIGTVTSQEEARVQAELTRVETFNALVDSEMIAQNVATKLTEKEATFAPRMLSVEQQLEQAVTVSNTASQKADAMASGSPKGVYATLALLQAAYPTGTTGAYLVLADGKWYYWSGAWTIGGTYQATGIADGGVNGNKLDSHLNDTLKIQPINLFNGITFFGTVDSANGVITNVGDTSRIVTDFIPITDSKPLRNNWLEKSVPSYSPQVLVFYNASKVFISATTTASGVNTPPAGAAYYRQNLKSGTSFTIPTGDYVAWQDWESTIKKNITDLNTEVDLVESVVDFKNVPINLFDGNTIVGVPSGSTGAMLYTDNSNYASTDFVPIVDTKPVLTNIITSQQAGYVFAQYSHVFYNSSKVFLSAISSSSGSVTPPTGAAYLKQTVKALPNTINTDLALLKIWQDSEYVVGRLDSAEKNIDDLLSEYGINKYRANIFHVNDFVGGVLTDSQVIKNCLDFSAIANDRVIIFDTKNWNIDEAILLPSNTTVIVDGVTIKQNNLVFDNIFRGNNLVINGSDPNGYPTSISALSNIKILGVNGATIEGCNTNATKTHPTLGSQLAVGDYWGWRTLQISLSKCTDFEIAGFAITLPRCWAISLDKCSNGKVHDLNIVSNVKNGDGVDLRSGCHDIDVYNISGSTSDDSVAMSAISYFPSGSYVYPMEPSAFEDGGYTKAELAIHDISVDNVSTTGAHHGVICLSNDGRKVYKVTINKIKEPSATTRESVVKIYAGYGSGYVAGDIYGIRVNDVLSKGATYGVQTVDATVSDVWFNKVVQEKAGGSVNSFSDATGITITNS